MNKLLIFAAGFAMGATGGYLIAKHYISEDCESQIHSVEAVYQGIIKEKDEALAKLEAMKEKETDISDTPVEAPVKQAPVSESEIQTNPFGVQNIEEYKKMLHQTSYDKTDEEHISEPREEEPESMLPDTPREDPYIISDEEFYDESDDYQKVELVYYTDDRLLVDSYTEEAENINETIGSLDVLKSLGEYEINTVFVRNEWLGIDYKVEVVGGSYTE